MTNKQLSSTKIILTEMRLKSEVMKNHLERMFKAHVQRILLGEHISKGLKSKGIRNYKNFKQDKMKLMLLLDEQLQEVSFVLNDIKSLNNLFDLLVATEQISLEIENKKSGSDASNLIDPESIPMRKYAYDLDQIKILDDSFEVLRIELERQKALLRKHDSPLQVDENKIRNEYGYGFSFEGSVNVQNLRSFCDTLNKRLVNHLSSSHMSLNSLDIETVKMIRELKEIKLDPSVFFSPNVYDFIRKFSKRRVLEREYENIIFYAFTFLLSRLKKHYPHEYYRRIRLLLLINDSAPYLELNDVESDFACATIIMDSFSKFEIVDNKISSEENRILAGYWNSAKKVIIEQVPNIQLLESHTQKELWQTRAKDLCLIAMQADSAYRTAYNKVKKVSYADVSKYIKTDNEELNKLSMSMVSRYEFLINPKGHFMSQYFLEPTSNYKQKNYKARDKKKVKVRKKTGKKR